MQLKWNYRKISMNRVAALRGIESDACFDKAMQVTGSVAALRTRPPFSIPSIACLFLQDFYHRILQSLATANKLNLTEVEKPQQSRRNVEVSS